MQLETDRLLLRPLRLEDIEHVVSLWADPEVTRFWVAVETLSRCGRSFKRSSSSPRKACSVSGPSRRRSRRICRRLRPGP
jgi:RimJ/RimL family protein N-acetyltransferase